MTHINKYDRYKQTKVQLSLTGNDDGDEMLGFLPDFDIRHN